LSDLDRKSIEPIALTFMGEGNIRGFQQFFKRGKLPDQKIKESYQEALSGALSAEGGMLCVDGSDFVKKGSDSVGVYRQHCGRLGKTENCQAGVFSSYVSKKGYGLIESDLYLPKAWFGKEYAEKRIQCQIPKNTEFKTKNEIASEQIRSIIECNKFDISWIGCDAAFGCDHKFLKSLPKSVFYFAATKENELVFLEMPQMIIPKSTKVNGRPFKHPRPSVLAVTVKEIAENERIPWEMTVLAQGTKGPVNAQIKCIRCLSCESTTQYGNYISPGEWIWLYIRRYSDGKIKYFVSNAPENTDRSTLDRLATMRWSIEQCFQECKSYLGMTHYETRTFQSWHRHMLFVMIAHLFTTLLRVALKKTPANHA